MMTDGEAEPVERHLQVCTRCLEILNRLTDDDPLLETIRQHAIIVIGQHAPF